VVGQEAPTEGSLADFARERSVVCERLAGLGREVSPLADLRALRGLIRLMRTFQPHVVHTHTAKAGALGRIAARLAGSPVVVHTFHGHVLRGYFPRPVSWILARIEQVLGRMSDAIVAVSTSVKADLVALGVAPADRIRVVSLGLDLEPLSRTLPRGGLRGVAGVPMDAPLVGAVGRLVPIKDLSTFLRAARVVRAARPDVHFAVVGDGECRAALEAESAALGLQDRVHFHGWRRDMAAVYGDLDVVVNCSRNEGTPVALIEALAAGRLVVATAVGGTPDLLQSGAHGRLVPPADPDALGAALLAVLAGDPADRARADAGRAHVLAHHAIPRLLSDMDAMYREACAARFGA
jgi:glycosyltransferase involved in cell wall biosynthesis